MQASSNSSKPMRDELLRNYCIIPEVKDSIRINAYIKFAERSFEYALNEYQLNNWNQAYIHLKKLLILIVNKLPSHSSFVPSLVTSQKVVKCAFDLLTDVVHKMDAAEDIRLQNENLDEFDMLGNEFDEDNDIPCSKPPDTYQALSPLPNEHNFPLKSQIELETQTNSSLLIDALQYLKLCKDNESSIIDTSNANNTELYPSIPSTVFNIEPEISNRYLGVSVADLEISRRLRLHGFYIPPPQSTHFELALGHGNLNFNFNGKNPFSFMKDDFHASFSSFLLDIPVELQLAKSAIEANRCFFLHLGVALDIHPFVLQTVFRNREFLPSVLQYAGFVDANVLTYLWFTEFSHVRICLVSGDSNAPIISCFSEKGRDKSQLHDVILHCNGSHFTLLRPRNTESTSTQNGSFSVISHMISAARASGLVVLENEVEPPSSIDTNTDRSRGSRSIESITRELIRG
eukprot:gene4243-8439_t